MARWPGCVHVDLGESCPPGWSRCQGGWGRRAWRIAAALRRPPEYLFDRELYGRPAAPLILELDAVPRLERAGLLELPPAPDERPIQAARRATIEAALQTLTPREARVVRRRVGLTEDRDEATYDV